MNELRLRPYLQMKGAFAQQGLRACCGTGDTSLRAVLSSFSLPIYEKWESLGMDRDRLGMAVGDNQNLTAGDLRITVQKFEHGTITDLGIGTVSAALSGGGGMGGGASLPETPYVLTLEQVKCNKKTEGEVLEDELWVRPIVSVDASLNEEGETVKLLDYRNDHVNAGQDISTNLLLYEGSLPDIFTLCYIAIEVDAEHDAEVVIRNFTEKIREDGELTFDSFSLETQIAELILWHASPLVALGLIGWLPPEMIAADKIVFLGEKLQEWSRGELPISNAGFIRLEGGTNLEVQVFFSRDENGDIREERRYTIKRYDDIGWHHIVDYVFTFRHFLGNMGGVAPNQPRNLSVEQKFRDIYNPNSGTSHFGHSTNRLSWEGVEGATGYIVERSVNEKPFVKARAARVHPPGVAGDSYMDANLQLAGEVIRYRVLAYNRNGFSSYSEILTVTLPVPAAPYGLSASHMPGVPVPGFVSIHVFWMVSCLGDYGYILERSRDGGIFVEVSAVAAHNPSTQGANYLDVVAAPRQGERIQYRVKGYNDFGEGSYSEILEVIV